MPKVARLLRVPVFGALVAVALALGGAPAAFAADGAVDAPVAPHDAAPHDAPPHSAPLLAAAPLAAAPHAAAPHDAAPLAAGPGDVNDFAFASFDARYDLGIDAEGHSTLATTETFVAEFPDFDQNRGIQRAIPLTYDGHPTQLTLTSVTDATGAPREYETETDDENLIVTIAGDEFVHGEQTYVLSYTQQDVTAYFSNTDDDEFYWDTNGTLWRQPFAVHTTTTTVPANLAGALTGDTACFAGPEGSAATPCTIERTDQGDTAVFTTHNENLAPGDNVTIGIAFQPHTFTERDSSYLAGGSSWVQLISTILAVGAAIFAVFYRIIGLRDAPGRPVIIPEYTPPPGADILIASVIMKKTPRAAAASFVDYAVRHNIQIVEQEQDAVFGSKTVYWLRLLTWQGLNPSEIELARVLFGSELAPGTWRELKKNDTSLSKSIYAVMQATKKRAFAEGYMKSGVRRAGSLLLVSTIVLAAIGFVSGALSLGDAYGGGLPMLFFVFGFFAIFVVVGAAFRNPLTAKGAELRDYIKGIEMYIDWAEEDRYKMLQSPEGALKTGVNAPDWGQVVKLYEKLLPYAVLLGLEAEWAKVLGTYYESLGNQPDWYGGGSGAFNAYLFASSIGALSSTASSSYSGSSSSSSSGFSGGGGYSGGGGGGGGGGGV
ncbi:DUF2207 domain-containing protein [Herbiconiux sp. P17]|uniref:DUF2207 family protein n=1 Tax=Herbiconiux wuyangfengii TaxID=3342794 RepID=UPI0035B78A2E